MTPQEVRRFLRRVIPLMKAAASSTESKIDDEVIRVLEFVSDDTVLIEEIVDLLHKRNAI